MESKMLLKVFILACVVILVAFVEQRVESRQKLKVTLFNHNHVDKAFKNFVNLHKKPYANDLNEYHKRSAIFKNNLNKIVILNQHEASNELGGAEYGINMFSDLTELEFNKQRLGFRDTLDKINPLSVDDGGMNFTEQWNNLLKEEAKSEEEILKSLPSSFDWRKHNGIVSNIKDQGVCGSCWAFASTGSIEGQYGVKRNQSVSLSEQTLLDCDVIDSACKGRLPKYAYRETMRLGGLENETAYPYEGLKKTCRLDNKEKRFNIDGYVNLPPIDEDKMRIWLVKRGPISTGLNADGLMLYRSGIVNPPRKVCPNTELDLNHGVLIVGYGEEKINNKFVLFWIIKNSWSALWGEQGYFRIFRGDNTCGLALKPSSAVLLE